ncbi:hypothetical protein BDV96DRAFT_639481 [Lophiotrema nucula]|uniref:DUF4604 domain-containing protein n=1 Tax=Lophiotrema nucula TaxID=690887 RepID=A0A6A5ZUG8_9PLEO|nr:hypothetical protein BDV96DRAFT_639481 [Lophiotrema nucula]
MSLKAKNLEYDNTQPAFLQRLRGQIASGDTSRHEKPIPRNKRMKKDDDEDDAPTYVLEDTNQSLSKEEYDALVAGKDPKEKEDSAEKLKKQDNPADEEVQSKERIAEVGKGSKKRKAVKVIGGSEEEEKDGSAKNIVQTPDAKVIKKPKKKAKPVKLSFDDQDEG